MSQVQKQQQQVGDKEKEKKKKETILDLSRYLDKPIRVKFSGGREASGVLKGFDPLLNLVLDGTTEYLRVLIQRSPIFQAIETGSMVFHCIFKDSDIDDGLTPFFSTRYMLASIIGGGRTWEPHQKEPPTHEKLLASFLTYPHWPNLRLKPMQTDPDDPYRLTDDTRHLGIVVCRGTSVVLICPADGMEAIANPFVQQEG